ncbi:MAG: succinate-semialdehyde dehydrogenase (NAD(P)+) [Acidobacteria bacterium OLB17]|nr:MAG: succinate-semialdehyde dehydrogenase (NAD(P)+) [Acidobacteria bacterium OLB17]MCZ2390478.1 aldehyde dehydrogenase family protein [Acidobacteriota bacterium]
MAESVQRETAKATEFELFDPATGERLGSVPVLDKRQVEEAVAAARAAFAAWERTSFAERRKAILRACEVVTAEMDTIARLISAETGKPVGEAISMEIAPVLDLMQFFAKRTAKILKPRRISIGLYGLLGRRSKIVHKPWGVVAIIPAWNYPFSIPLGEAAMALMAGNTVVIKPAEATSLTGLLIGDIFQKAGVPKDVVTIVTGAGETGAALVAARPDKVMFTGSVATGKKIAAEAAKELTSTVLELGGKDPMIVFADANLKIAAKAAVWGAFCNAGQSCSSVERLYVERSAADELTRLIVEETKALKQGVGTDEDVSVGSMSSERQLRVVEDHVEDFRREGATIVTGGRRREGTLFYEPTVITNTTNRMRGMREETFGPTLPIAIFDTEREAAELANDSEFGLTASVWSGDRARARRVAEQIHAGTVTINEVLYTHGIGQTPWGGFKNSGRGRTHGAAGLFELVQAQHIHENLLAVLPDAWWMPYSPNAVKTFRAFATKFATGSILKTASMVPQLLRRIMELRRK